MWSGSIYSCVIVAVSLAPLSPVFSQSRQDSTAEVVRGVPATFTFFLNRPPFIKPQIVEDLNSWISDGGNQVIAIDILGSQESNRYFGEVELAKDDEVYATVTVRKSEEQGGGFFSYRYIGTTTNGLHILQTFDNGGGRFTSVSYLLLFALSDTAPDYSYDQDKLVQSNRQLLLKVCEIPLHEGESFKSSLKGNRFTFGGTEDGLEKPTTLDLASVKLPIWEHPIK